MIGNIKAHRAAQGRLWQKHPPWTLCRWYMRGGFTRNVTEKVIANIQDLMTWAMSIQ